MDVSRYEITSDVEYRLDLICEKLYGEYTNNTARLLIESNPQIDVMDLSAGTVLKVPPKSLLGGI